MEFLNAQLKYITEQLRGMSVSQRVAIALLLVILVGGMWGMIHWGRQTDWTPLLEQALTPEQIQEIEAQLAAAGVQTKVEGDRMYISGGENERRRVHSVLAQNNALPKDTSLSYAALVKNDNVWKGDQQRVWEQYRALETELAAVLSQFGGIRDAHVQIVVPERRGISQRASAASASVKVTLPNGEALDKQRILAIANYVAGAVPGLAVRNISITDGSQLYRPPDAVDGAMTTDILDIQRQVEEHYRQKVYDQLKHIKDVVVNVHARLRQNDEHREEIKLGEPVVSSEESKTQETAGTSGAREPSVRPNTRVGLAETGPGSSSNLDESKTDYNGDRDKKRIESSDLRGTLEQLTASITVPHTYLLRVLEAQQPGSQDTSPAALQKTAEIELPKIRDLVRPLIGATEDAATKLVVVDWYYAVPEEAAASTATASVNVLAMLKDYAPQAGLGLLACFSLFMVFRIARKAQASVATAHPQVALAGGAAPPIREIPLQPLGGGPTPVGEAQGMEGVLIGHEVDEKMVRTQQIIRQIGQMVKDDPAMAAGIVDYWLGEEK